MTLLLAFSFACTSKTAEPKSPGVLEGSPMFIKLSYAKNLKGDYVGTKKHARATIVAVFASWCSGCKHELAMLKQLAAKDETIRVVGLNYFEEFQDQGSDEALRSFVKDNYPSLEVVKASQELWTEFGSPSKIPSMYVFDRRGNLVRSYIRSVRPPPSKVELEATLLTLE